MVSSGKYNANDPDFDETTGVLRNMLGITDPAVLEHVETEAIAKGFDELILSYSETHVFGEADVRRIHHTLFRDVFSWAGTYRHVDISSESIRWCHAQFIDNEMQRFGKLLTELSPLSPDMDYEEVIRRLARIHGELIVIHPFRDGNGRTTRTLEDLLLLQAKYEPISQPLFYRKDIRPLYHLAIQEVWRRMDYRRLEALLRFLIPPKA